MMSTDTMTSPWGTKVNNSEGGDYERPPTGSIPATCVALIDMGTHRETYGDKENISHKVLLAWELSGEAKKDGTPFVVIEEYTWSLGKKANLRAVVEGWISRTLKEDEIFPLIELLGKSCVLSLTEGLSRAGKKFVAVNNVSAPMKGLTIEKPTLELFSFNLSEIGSTLDELNIPTWIPYLMGKPVTDKIKASSEYQSLPNF